MITSKEDLSLLRVPCVVQQYHDHGGVLFKVYVIDGDVMVFRRRSLPDLHCAYSDSSQEGGKRTSNGGVNGWHHSARCAEWRCGRLRSVAFDSRRSYPTYAAFLCEDCAAAPETSSQGAGDETDGVLAGAMESIPTALLGEHCLSDPAACGLLTF